MQPPEHIFILPMNVMLEKGANDLPGAAADKTSLSPVVNRVVQQRQKAILLMVWSRKGTANTVDGVVEKGNS
ncbi:hypothetical protein YC2023_076493 [Brassica napus]